MPQIIETFQNNVGDSDLLKAPGRLTSIPFNGRLIIEASCTVCDESNNATISIQVPDSEIPFENHLIPANGYDSSNSVLHDNTDLQFEYPAFQGGHFGVKMLVSGNVLWFVRVTLLSE